MKGLGPDPKRKIYLTVAGARKDFGGGGDETVIYLNCDGGYIIVYLSKLTELYTKNSKFYCKSYP